MNRRHFLQKTLSGTIGTSLILLNAPSSAEINNINPSANVRPTLRKKIGHPVIIESVELLKYKDEFITIVTSKDGAKGICIGNGRIQQMLTFFRSNVKPFFIGKDATQIETLIEEIYTYRRNYKYAGLSLWNSLAQIELAILDLLGKTANLPVNALMGDVIRTEIPVYMSSLLRSTTAEEEVEWVSKRVRETGAKAVKLKIGGRMSKNKDAYPGRTEDLIRLSREHWGNDFTIYMAANGSYDVAKAIEIGKYMEEYNIGFYEEPVPWEDFAGTKAVYDALSMPVVGGEQDHNMFKWQWMIEKKGFDTVQPDIMYNGGFIRTMKVAEMARKKGINCTLHSPKRNGIAAYMLHFTSITSNIGAFQEWSAKQGGSAKLSPEFAVVDGKVSVPTGPGFGVGYDLDYMGKFKSI